MSGDGAAALAAADQDHAAVEAHLDSLMGVWVEARRFCADGLRGRSDEVSVLSHILAESDTDRLLCVALLAAAMCRLAGKDE